MRLDNSYYLDYSDYCLHLHCYLYNVSADVPSGLLQVFLVGLWNLLFALGNLLVVIGSHHGTLNLTLHSVHGGNHSWGTGVELC